MLSVIVLTHHSYTKKWGCIEHVLLALLNQKNIFFEIIVVDNSAPSEDRDRLRQFVAPFPVIRIVCCPNLSRAAARNEGVRHARGKVLVFIDDDTILLAPGALTRITELARRKRYGFGAWRRWTPPGDWFAAHAEKIRQELLAGCTSFLGQHVGLPERSIRLSVAKVDEAREWLYQNSTLIANFGFVSASALARIGGFPEQFEGYGPEDIAAMFLLYLQFGRPALLREINVAHVSHPLREEEPYEAADNFLVFDMLQRCHGVKKFRLFQMLHPEFARKLPIVERLV